MWILEQVLEQILKIYLSLISKFDVFSKYSNVVEVYQSFWY